jgi:uncharacterized protein GlcG (DUF336 family)
MALSFTRNNITLDTANLLAEKAINHAREIGTKMVVAIVDTGGHLVALKRDDNAFAASISIATDKATTSATFGLSTDDLCNALKSSPMALDGISRRPNTIMFGGGYPIILNGEIIGGIGVSGGSEDQDRQCAKKALEELN